MKNQYNPDIHHRRSIRLGDYDYTQAGAYFVTICSRNRECVFGDVVDGVERLNEFGDLVKREWLWTMNIRPNVELDEFIVMPNHIHGILIINHDCRGTLQRAPTKEQFGKPVSNSIPTIIRLFKSTTTKQLNELRNTAGIPVWQRNYFEHIIRNDEELNRIREYIITNPLKWAEDENNPLHHVGAVREPPYKGKRNGQTPGI
jgi:REP element-mobilizing transposase RayT